MASRDRAWAMQNIDWPSIKKTFLQTIAGFGAGSLALSFWLWEAPGAIVTLFTILFLLFGLWISEGLIGVMTRTKVVSPTMVIFLFTGKLAWWLALFLASRRIPVGLEYGVALGMGCFLLSLVLAVLSHAYLPKNIE